MIRNALFSNIVIMRGGIGIHFQSAFWPGPGVAISNITFRDVVARNVALPFHISPGKPEATAQIENIVIDGYRAEVFADAAIVGTSQTRPRNIRLSNISLTVVPHPGQLGPGWDAPPDTLLRIRAADDVTLENVSVEWRTDARHWKRTLFSEGATGLKVGDDCRLPDPGDVSGADNKVTEAVSWLEGEAHRIIRASRREMKDGTAAFPPQVGIGYEAFWLRDYEYMLEGSIASFSDKELTHACRLFVRSLNADGAGVDCVKFDGIPVYKPGYGSMGENPVADGSQFTVGVAFHTYSRTEDAKLLAEILPALVKTMGAVPRNPETGLVHIDPRRAWDRCPYGFTDSVRKQGDVLFDSLLFVQACRQLADLLQAGQREAEAGKWKDEAGRVATSVRNVFWDKETGLFRVATVKCREHDIWGSAFAVFLGVADADQSQAIARYFKTHYDQIVQHGQIRHLPGGVYWEQGCARDHYQNGAYWGTSAGWFVYTLDLVDPMLADKTILDMVNDFKKHGACEWIISETRHLPNYLASAALPLDGIRAMLDRRKKAGK